jgi:hypothetical protein
VLASYPVSVLIIGIGEGPFKGLEELESNTLNKYFRNMLKFVHVEENMKAQEKVESFFKEIPH